MNTNVYEELKQTIHFTNRSGVRATCPDCHVPHQWTDKIARKMQASKEVWGKIFGTINTRDKFVAMRRELAEHEWARLKANNSLECRNCHSAESMDITKQECAGSAGSSARICSPVSAPASTATKASPTSCRTWKACRRAGARPHRVREPSATGWRGQRSRPKKKFYRDIVNPGLLWLSFVRRGSGFRP